MLNWWKRRKAQKQCFHHEYYSNGECKSLLKSTLIDLGRRKLIWCTECEMRWVI